MLCLFLGLFLFPQVRHVYLQHGPGPPSPNVLSKDVCNHLPGKNIFFCQENCGSLTLSQMNKWLKNVGIIDGRKVQRVTQKRCMISKNVGDIDLEIRDRMYK